MRREPNAPPAALADPPGLRVTVAGGRTSVPVVLAASRPWTLGRAAEADVVVDDTRVSRRHLVLEPAGGAWIVRDVSSNGTWSGPGRIPPAGLTVPPGREAVVRLGAPDGPEIVLASTAAVSPGVPSFAPVPPPARRRRRGRGLLIALGVLVVLLLAADRVAAAVAGTAAVSRIVQQSQGLVREPSVSFGGFPFLTQVVAGDYSDVHVELADLTPPDAPRIDRIDAHLRGAHLPLGAVVGGDVSSVPVDRIDATVGIGFDDLNAYLAQQVGGLVVSAAGDGALRVTGTLALDGTEVEVAGSARLTVDGGDLLLTPVDVQVGGGGDPLGDLAGGIASLLPPVPVPLDGLPFDLQLRSVTVGDAGITASAQASGLTLQVPR